MNFASNSLSPINDTGHLTTVIPAISPEEFQQRVVTVIIFSTLCAIGSIANALPVFLSFCTQMRKNNVHLMVGSLSVADFGFSFLFLVTQPAIILYREQIGYLGCKWTAWFPNASCAFDALFVPVVSLNRYISLYHAEYYKRIYTKRNVVLMVLGCWFFAIAIPLIFTFGDHAGYDHDNEHCCIILDRGFFSSFSYWNLFYLLSMVAPSALLGNAIMISCTYKIYKKLSDHNKVTTLKCNVIAQNRDLLYFLLADMTLGIFFNTLYQAGKIFYTDRVDIDSRRAFIATYMVNSCLRGIVTLCMLRPYRHAVTKLLCPWKHKNDVSPVGPANIRNIRCNLPTAWQQES